MNQRAPSPRPVFRPVARPVIAALAEDSLAFSLLSAARVLATVMQGRNLDVALAAAQLPPAVRPRVMDLAYSTLRAFARGDFLLGRLMQKKLKDQEVRSLLLLALTQLESRPTEAHTTVNQAVAAAGLLAGGNFRALVNGVLRNFLRQQDDLLAQAEEDAQAKWQHPLWWQKLLQQAYPEQWTAILQAGNSHPPMSLRVNQGKTTLAAYLARLLEAGIGASACGEVGIRLERPLGVDRLPDFFAGQVSVQDIGAQQAAVLLDVQAGMRVLDACAAPGGKTAHILERAKVDLLALDSEPKRAARISENLQRLGLEAGAGAEADVKVKAVDCRRVADWWDGRLFDRILADVPCSASGVVRRHPDAKWLRRAEDVASFAATQRQIIDALWPLLAPGGKMLYCTCSVFPAENQNQMKAFLARHGDALALPLSAQHNPPDTALQLLPDADHDGFFYALLEKRAS